MSEFLRLGYWIQGIKGSDSVSKMTDNGLRYVVEFRKGIDTSSIQGPSIFFKPFWYEG